MSKFLKATSWLSRILFILGIGVLYLGILPPTSIELIFFSFIFFFYPSFAIEMSKNNYFKNSNIKLIVFLSNTKIISRILFDFWLLAGIAGSGFILSDIPLCLFLTAIIIISPIVYIEWSNNPVFKNFREKTELKRNNKRLNKKENNSKNTIISPKNTSSSHIKEIEVKNKASVYALIKDNSQNKTTNETIVKSNTQTNLKELEAKNKESVYALIKDNQSKQANNTDITNENSETISISVESDRLAQDIQERINCGEAVFSNSTWGYAKTKHITKPMKTENPAPIKQKSEETLLKELLNDIDEMDGHQFEYFCADILKKNGYTNVNVTPGSGDQGADIIAEKDEIKYAIQCKRFHKVLNNKAVQEVSIGRVYYKCDIGVVLTNNYFNDSAKAAANAARILLWDRDKLVKLIKMSGKLKTNK